ncbi:MAG TPA: cupredoxin domain-containing protein [Burkholderiales bacterium]|nr:cupredoxin domain-containing protein [Burkholderiales bacterium]
MRSGALGSTTGRDGRQHVLIAAAALSLAAFAAPVAAAPQTHTIVMEATAFTPASLTVKRGDRVVWVNKDPFPHTATAAKVFDSKSVAPGKKWTYVANKAGTFDYVCSFHPTMHGTLKVE